MTVEPLDCALNAPDEDSIMFSVDHAFDDMKEGDTGLAGRRSSLNAVREKISSEKAKRILKL